MSFTHVITKPVTVLVLAISLAGCADKQVTLKYAPDTTLSPIEGASRVAAFQFI
jgi:uncharacterized lipoprotein YehR (DUF1307 family)